MTSYAVMMRYSRKTTLGCPDDHLLGVWPEQSEAFRFAVTRLKNLAGSYSAEIIEINDDGHADHCHMESDTHTPWVVCITVKKP